MSKLRSLYYAIWLLSLSGLTPLTLAANNQLQLPALGEASAGLMLPSDEYALGQSLLRLYRAALPESSDPFIEAYLGDLLTKIATYSDLKDKRLELLVLESPTLNAFAAPGGIVGVNTGTFLTAENEQQLASILAHELAHLSQRHHARHMQQRSTANVVNLAATIAALMVAAAGNSDAGFAAIPAINAASIDSALRFSRQVEHEADRIGMQTLVDAGFDPYAMPAMFEQLMKATRYRTKVPEFLMTHPITESRVADSTSRARRYPKQQHPPDEEYQFIRARVVLHYEDNPSRAVKRFRSELDGNTMPAVAARYGLVLALSKAGDIDQARQQLKILKTESKHAVALTIAEADINAADSKMGDALAQLKAALQTHPNNHPLNIRYAELLMQAGEYETCETVLLKHVKRRPQNAYAWYLLAEVHGLAGHILDVHKARAEYFILMGIFQKAEIQLRNALRLIKKDDFQGRAKIEQRLLDIKKMSAESLY